MSGCILGIESSCDDTSAAVVKDGFVVSNVIANQDIHKLYGGVVPELASRAHQQNIIPVIDTAIKKAGLTVKDIDAIAFTRGPGLLGALLVGTSFAKGLGLALDKPLIDVNHIQGHMMASFLQIKDNPTPVPTFPYLSVVVSGGHTQICIVKDYLSYEIIGSTIDDAAGEAFDKCAKVLGLPYPGGPEIDKLAKFGDKNKYSFSKPRIPNLDFSFSGLKTAFLYFLRDQLKLDENFVKDNINDISASIQHTIVEILLEKLVLAVKQTGLKSVAFAGGVSANSYLRDEAQRLADREGYQLFLPERRFTTDNAAMIAITGYYKYQKNEFCGQDITPMPRM
jgi:N6-L-threonylcarbamoyladenine synthase